MKLSTRADTWQWFSDIGVDRAAEVIAANSPATFGLDVLEMRIRDSGYPEVLPEIELVEYRGIAEPDKWGNQFFATVLYNSDGNLTSWGGKRDPGNEAGMAAWQWSCYAD
jgi:hypothetical protein